MVLILSLNGPLSHLNQAVAMKMKINHLGILDKILASYDIDKNDLCMIGSSTLAANGIRENNDIDICLLSSVQKSLFPDMINTTTLVDKVDIILSKKYEVYFGIGDDDIIQNSKYHEIFNGYKIIKLELEFAAKLMMRRDKDANDIEKIIEYARSNSCWDWTLVLDAKKNKSKFRLDPTTSYLPRKIYNAIKHPIRASKQVVRINSNLLKKSVDKYRKKKQSLQSKLEFSTDIIDDALMKYPTSRLLEKQFTKNRDFNRMDLFVRYMAIEDHFNKNDIGYPLYNKMQFMRGAVPGYEERFRALIESVTENGLSDTSPISIDSLGNLIDGAHRTALAQYLVLDTVSIKVEQSKYVAPYEISWFKANAFSAEECELIEKKKEELLLRSGIYFPAILWPSIQDYFEEATKEIKKNYPVIKTKDFRLSDREFCSFIREVYAIDDIAQWKIDRKIAFLMRYNIKSVRVVWMEIAHPRYRKKALNMNNISQEMEAFKQAFRENYQRKVKDYIHDIVLHAGDNYEHNIQLNRIYEKY